MPKKKPEFVPPKTVRVYVERNGAGMSADVEWNHGAAVLKAFLDMMRQIAEEYPELVQQIDSVPGGIQQVYDPFVDGFGKQSPSKRPVGF